MKKILLIILLILNTKFCFGMNGRCVDFRIGAKLVLQYFQNSWKPGDNFWEKFWEENFKDHYNSGFRIMVQVSQNKGVSLLRAIKCFQRARGCLRKSTQENINRLCVLIEKLKEIYLRFDDYPGFVKDELEKTEKLKEKFEKYPGATIEQIEEVEIAESSSNSQSSTTSSSNSSQQNLTSQNLFKKVAGFVFVRIYRKIFDNCG